MAKIPEQPFAPADFSPKGGGIDYLGMRWVSMVILGGELIPEINNRTRDFGIFCLATWMPWKFRQLCEGARESFTLSNYRNFEEAVGVAISYSVDPNSDSSEKYGQPHERIGVQQKLVLPSELSFSDVERTRSTSIFAAALYGPALRYLQLVGGYARAADGTSTEIPLPADNETTELIAKFVDDSLSQSKNFRKLAQVCPGSFNVTELNDLADRGIHPAFYRRAPKAARLGFLRQLLPSDPQHGRTKTAELTIKTLELVPGLGLEELRSVWHSGLTFDGIAVDLSDERLESHRIKWSVFQTRQYQRYIVELFMKAFEDQLIEFSLLDDVVSACVDPLPFENTKLVDLIYSEAAAVSQSRDLMTVSKKWNQTVHGVHESYDWIEPDEVMDTCERGLRMLARWWIRTHVWMEDDERKEFFLLGGEDRIGIRWFHQWIANRFDQPISVFVKEVMEQLVFGQHIRVALSRFDGSSQKLRFVLGDDGIVPTKSAINKMGKSVPGWTQDRLIAFTDLLCDVGVLIPQDDGGLKVGPLAKYVGSSDA